MTAFLSLFISHCSFVEMEEWKEQPCISVNLSGPEHVTNLPIFHGVLRSPSAVTHPQFFICSNSGKLPTKFPLQWRKPPLASFPIQSPRFSTSTESLQNTACVAFATLRGLSAETGPFSSLHLEQRGQCTVYSRNSRFSSGM